MVFICMLWCFLFIYASPRARQDRNLEQAIIYCNGNNGCSYLFSVHTMDAASACVALDRRYFSGVTARGSSLFFQDT